MHAGQDAIQFCTRELGGLVKARVWTVHRWVAAVLLIEQSILDQDGRWCTLVIRSSPPANLAVLKGPADFISLRPSLSNRPNRLAVPVEPGAR
jgi:hypothetical protein